MADDDLFTYPSERGQPVPVMPETQPVPEIPTRGSPGPIDFDWTVNAQGGVSRDNNPPSADDLNSGKFVRAPLSNGRFFNVPAGTDQKTANTLYTALQGMLDDKYTELAQSSGNPYETQDKVYSATGSYPNNVYGRARAAFDQYGAAPGDATSGYGNIVRSKVLNPVSQANVPGSQNITQGKPFTWGDVGESVARVAPYWAAAPLAPIDATIGTLGAIKHGFAPNEPPVETPGDVLRHGLGVPDLPADASTSRRIAEAVLSGFSPRSLLTRPGLVQTPLNVLSNVAKATPSAALSTWGSDLGGYSASQLLGPNWRETGEALGGIAGASTPGMGTLYFQRRLAGGMRVPPGGPAGSPPSSEEVANAGQALADEQTARTGQPTPNMASIRAMIAPEWQRIFNWLAASPYWGQRFADDASRHEQAVRQAKDDTVTQVSGGTVQPGTGSPEAIGNLATTAAREAMPRILQAREQGYNDLAANTGVTPQDEVSVLPVVGSANAQLGGNIRSGSREDAARAIINNDILQSAQTGHRFDVTGRPNAPMPVGGIGPPEPHVPYGLLQDVLSSASNQLPGGQMTSDRAVPLIVKNAALAGMEGHLADLGAAPNDLTNARATFSHYTNNVLPQFEKIAGETQNTGRDAQGNPTYTFGNPPRSGQIAHDLLLGDTAKQSSEEYGRFAQHIDPFWQNQIAAHAIDLMGRSTGALGGGTRPEAVATGYHRYSAPLMETLLSTAPPPTQPGELSATERLGHAATMGEATNLNPSRTGLVSAAGTGVAIRKLVDLIQTVAPGSWGSFLAGNIVKGIGGEVTDPAFKRQVAGTPLGPDILNRLYGSMPTAATTIMNRSYRPGGGPF